jgi:hypothetical protein
MGMRKDLILNQEEIQRRKDSARNRKSNSLPNSESVLLTSDEIDRVSSLISSIFIKVILYSILAIHGYESR